MNATRVSGLIRIATLSCSVCVSAVTALRLEPPIAMTTAEIEDTQHLLRSDEVAFARAPQLASERGVLAKRYAATLVQKPDAAFLQRLGVLARRRGLTLVTSSFTLEPRSIPQPDRSAIDPSAAFPASQVSLTLAGRYDQLLAATAELSSATNLVFVDYPSLRRDGSVLVEEITAHIARPDLADTLGPAGIGQRVNR